MVDVYEYLRSDVGSSAIEVFTKRTLYGIPYIDMAYFMAAGKWSSGISAFAPAATAARLNAKSITWLRTNLHQRPAF